MEPKAGAQISSKAFIQSLLILLLLMLAAGVLTKIIPAGEYSRVIHDKRQVIDPNSYQPIARPAYPFWRWLTAPLEVLDGPDSLTISMIIVFLLMVGSAFAVLDKTGLLKAAIGRVVKTFGGRKYILLLAVSLFFMLLGAFFGIFEEVVPLVPMMIALSYSLGWDALIGLGMSILATNVGFSAAITNPFTIGVAQKIAGLPLFSGAGLRLVIFGVFYSLLALFLTGYARRIERDPHKSPVYAEEQKQRQRLAAYEPFTQEVTSQPLGKALAWLALFLILILLVLIAGPLVPALSDFAMPLVGVFFLAGGIGAGLLSGASGKAVLKMATEGVLGIAPAIPLILMAASVKYIVAEGAIIDTILHGAVQIFPASSPFLAALIIYGLALVIEFFVSSGSAKAFLLMPILLPLADLVGVTRQATVTAYCFGDGFSNLAYPTNPVLLICLGLTVVSYPKWLKWSLKLWGWVVLVTLAFLGIAVAIRFGPF